MRIIDLCKAKRLKLDELATARYRIEDAAQAFEDMKKNARGMVMFG